VEELITTFEQLAIRIEDLTDFLFKECFISGLREDIHAQVLMQDLATWLEASPHTLEAKTIIIP
jgi:hypothetical protein